MINSDLFDAVLTVEETNKRKLHWKFLTDLPCGTRVIIAIDRLYKDYEDNDCLWSLFNESLLIQKLGEGDFNGGHGEIIIDNQDSKALEEFNEYLDEFSAGIKTPVSDEIIVNFTVGARQPIKAFGKNNINLSGAAVDNSGGINVVCLSKQINIPIKSKYQPVDFDKQ